MLRCKAIFPIIPLRCNCCTHFTSLLNPVCNTTIEEDLERDQKVTVAPLSHWRGEAEIQQKAIIGHICFGMAGRKAVHGNRTQHCHTIVWHEAIRRQRTWAGHKYVDDKINARSYGDCPYNAGSRLEPFDR